MKAMGNCANNRCVWAWALAVGWWTASAALALDLPEMYDDAALHDVAFVDARTGVAVGDRGMVLKTDDRGRTWARQSVPTTVHLQAVQFVDRQNGWIVGGQRIAFTGVSTGVVLKTFDGARTWVVLNRDALPRLNDVCFVDAKHGWAVGESTAAFTTGAHFTTDGGRTWMPAPGQMYPALLRAAFQGFREGVAVGRGGALVSVRQLVPAPARSDAPGPGDVNDVCWPSDRTVWAVGQAGTVLRSKDGGLRWEAFDVGLSAEARAVTRFKAVTFSGRLGLIAGSPGTFVWRTTDAGATWHRVPTGQRAPIHALCMVDPKHGLAVGSLGTILRTDDGARSWQRVRSGGSSCSMLWVHARPDDVDTSALARYAAEGAYLASVLCVTRPVRQAPASGRLAAARDMALEAGATAADWLWGFPPSPVGASVEQCVAQWSRTGGESAVDRLHRQLVGAVRLWRPSIIVTDSPVVSVQDRPEKGLVGQAMRRAYGSAGHADVYPEQIEELGLEAWRPMKLFVGIDPDPPLRRDKIDITCLDATAEGPRLKRPYLSVGQQSAGRLVARYEPVPTASRFRLLETTGSTFTPQHDLFTGLVLGPGAPGRRRFNLPTDQARDQARRITQRRAMLTGVAQRLLDKGQWPDLLAHIGTWSRPRDHWPTMGDYLMRYVPACQRTGRWWVAEEIHGKLLKDCPDHPGKVSAYRWLMTYFASSEVLYERVSRSHMSNRARTALQLGRAKSTSRSPADGGAPGRTGTWGNAEEQTLLVGGAVPPWFSPALALGQRLKAEAPAVWADPAVQFLIASAWRSLNQPRRASDLYRHYLKQHRTGLWARNARGELWLASRRGLAPKPVWPCPNVKGKLVLDGTADEEFWQKARPVRRFWRSVDQPVREQGMMARAVCNGTDLLLAVTCEGAPVLADPMAVARAQTHSAHERLELLIDLDRDYASAYRFVVDLRGQRSQDCWGNAQWGARWAAAVRRNPESWSAEIRIPMATLGGWAGGLPPPGSVWCANLVRRRPGRPYSAWSVPAGEPPRVEGCGYLVLAQRPAGRPSPRR